ncbi:unnamed protein product, partial [Iphiclides podalirius]
MRPTGLMIILGLVQSTRQNLVSTAQGLVRGVARDGYVSYVGIPYASANVTGRFKRAGLAPVWNGIREANDPRCMASSQVDKCLQLDIHVSTSDGYPWPVLVWVKGGNGFYHPGKLVRQGIIVVIVRHRMGALGFLCTELDQIPGNGGVKDVVLALRWLRDNIVAFKGNPNKVVVGGESFGAAMVETLMLSQMSRGLFQGAIMQSGTALSPWAFNYDALLRTNALKEAYNDDDNFPDMLFEANLEDLETKTGQLEMPYLPFAICVERSFKKEERLLAEPPYELLSEGKTTPVPLIIGYNNNEAYIFASVFEKGNVLKRLSDDMTFLIPTEFGDMSARELNQTREKIKQNYFRNKNFSTTSLLAYHSDAYFINHIHRSARLHSSASPYPVFYYQFSHSGETGVEPESGMDKVGAAHSDELSYLFPENGRSLAGDDGKVQENLVALWSNFVKHLNPTPHSEDAVLWEPVDYQQPRLLNIAMETEMIDYPHEKASEMWDELYEKYYTRRRKDV